MHSRAEPGRDSLTEELIRSELHRVLASEPFSRSERLSGFLRFVVDETLSGRADTLKEAVLAATLYGKAPDFDGAENPVVRVDARRVRDKLREYYSSAAGGPVVISLPKGSYVPAFAVSADAKPSAHDNPAETAAATVRRTAVMWPGIAVVLGVVVVAAAAYAILPARVPRPEPTAGRIVIAVLPFQNLTGDPGQEYLCDGLTEEMIALLGSTASSSLDVIARTSAMHYKNTTKKADEIARELGVGYLLETSLRRVGDRVRITAQLIDASTQRHVWIEQYERDVGDVIAMQRDVASAIARRTVASLGLMPTGSAPRATLGVTSSPAYEHYLRGRYHWAKDTKGDLLKALDHFQQAIAIAPSYARAYSGLAETYALLGSYDLMPIAESHSLGRQAALRAIELDESLAEAHRSLSAIVADHYWDWMQVERHYAQALALDPADVTTLRFYSFYLAYTGRAEEAIGIAQKASRLDPVSPGVQMNLGVVFYFARQFAEAVQQLQETIELEPDFAFAHSMLGLAFLSQGMPDRALAEVQRAREVAELRPDVISVQGHVLGATGHRREALATIDDLRRLAQGHPPSAFNVASVYVGLRDNDEAIGWLEKAVEARNWEMPMLKASPAFDAIRSDPRFQHIVARVGLRD